MAKESSWRRTARTVISKVIREVGRYDLKTLKRAISAAYPFGPKRYHPYKIWLDEVKLQLYPDHPKKRKKRRKPRHAAEQFPTNQPLPGQKTLFD